ncbi:hypothetical protein B0H67DRAFT_329532 [Lasiosphaeris hirsuta]|uniref:Uncharacterized protein n=1 Tax=Lasiosphaeris hirsuta TaxID=260670 RepID=A0AA40DNX6_9PEZI|nr:hypothetical protein B0H67DRAFT_329532 [Lasiosphaeris hirsuta]
MSVGGDVQLEVSSTIDTDRADGQPAALSEMETGPNEEGASARMERPPHPALAPWGETRGSRSHLHARPLSTRHSQALGPASWPDSRRPAPTTRALAKCSTTPWTDQAV